MVERLSVRLLASRRRQGRLVSRLPVILWLAVATGLLGASGRSSSAADGSQKPPHIVIIFTDDMGVSDLGCYGGTIAATPNIDRLAAEGTRYTQFYSAAPICSPSRCGLLTGMRPARWSITSYLQTREGNRGCEMVDFLDPAAPTLPRILKSVGYQTAHFGKWHLGGGRDVVDAPRLAAYGYDEVASTWESPELHPDLTGSDWIWSDQDRVKRWDRTAFFVDQTLDFLRRHKDEAPCFVNLWPDDVHTPWVPDEASDRKASEANLTGVLVEYDRQIGRLMAGLKDLGLDDSTLVIFTSDNGAAPTFGGRRSAPFRSGKTSLYEGGIRMPMIARWPGRTPPGRVDETSVWSTVDFVPTLAALAGATLPPATTFDGEDFTPVLVGESQNRTTPLIWEYGRNNTWFKYPPPPGRSPPLAIRDGNWKLLTGPLGRRVELYDVVADPGETTDRAAEFPELVATLKGRLLAWRTGWPKWTDRSTGVTPSEATGTPARPASTDGASAGPMARSGRVQPNIVVFLTDDQDRRDCEAYGPTTVKTPNMARLAAAGLTFENAYVASPSCAPSRAALLTGLMPARNGAEDNHTKARPEIKTLPRLLRDQGYDVVSFGKVAHYNHGGYYGFEPALFEGFHDHHGIPAAAKFLQDRDPETSRPLCLFVGTNWPHRPWPKGFGGYDPATTDLPPSQVDTEITRQYRARYEHAVSLADADLGTIYDAAKRSLGPETIFLFSSDHGAQWPFGKWNCYEASLATPLIVEWPGVTKPGHRTDAMVSWIDILPTLVEIVGGTAPPSGSDAGQIDGRSFRRVLTGEVATHRDRIFASHSGDQKMNVYPIRSLRVGDWKYVRNLHPEFQHTTHVDRAQAEDEVRYFRSWERAAEAGDTHAAAVIARYRRRPAEELYNLRDDPYELRNLANAHAEAGRLATFRGELDAWMAEQGDTGPVFHEPIRLPEATTPRAGDSSTAR